MLNYFKFVEILISVQSIFISTMIPVFISIPLTNNLKYSYEFPITLQIPIIILLTLIFKSRVSFVSLTIYILLGLFFIPVFHQGGSLGYLLAPNFGYLIGYYPLIKIIDNLNKKNKIYINEFLKTSIVAIVYMHITGIIYSLIQILYYKQFDLFLYNLGSYSLGKIGYHFLMLIPLTLLIKPINYLRINK